MTEAPIGGAETGAPVPAVDVADAEPPAPRAKRLVRVWRGLARVLGRAIVVCLAIVFIAYVVSWEAGPLPWILALLPWFLIPAVAALALLAAGRAWIEAGLATVVIVLLAWTQVPLFTATDATPTAQRAATVATLNMRFGEADPDAIVAMVRDDGIDVLALVEITHDAVAALDEAGLGELLPYSIDGASTLYEGAALYSATPIADRAIHGGMVSRAVSGTIQIGGSSIDVWVAHPMVPGVLHHDAWSEDFTILTHWLGDVDGPSMLLGDLNATRDHSGVREIEALGFTDAVDDAGAGFLPTFPANSAVPPLVAIDHIMASANSLTATGAHTVTIPGTDHRALVATYVGE